jgi:hypothetical protein
MMDKCDYIKKVNRNKKLTKREKDALLGRGKKSKKGKRLTKKQQEEYMKQVRAKHPYYFNKILFENNLVKIKLPKLLLKHTSFKPSQLIFHFKAAEIRRAARKLLAAKRKFNF